MILRKNPNIELMMDDLDRKIIRELQIDASQSVDELANKVALSRNACWRRMRNLEDRGVIQSRVALVDADALGIPLKVLVMVKTSEHDADWAENFRNAVSSFPEITGAYRMSGELDYVLRVQVVDVRAYDAFYQRLTKKLKLSDISASFVMEEIKETTALPV